MHSKVDVPILDFHITHNCNLTCESCSDFTNHGHSRMISLEEGKRWIGNWNNRIQPKQFIILGGEPTLHKDLIDFLYLSREMWGNTYIKLTTNGFFLHNHEGLGEAIKENNINLSLSIHSKSKDYVNRIKDNLKLCLKWKNELGINVSVNTTHEYWTQIYKGYGENILPFEDNDAEASWNNCFMEGTCFQLHEGMIWKCPPIAYLPLMAKKYELSKKWDPYLKYNPLKPNCSHDDIVEFFNRKSENICRMCPAHKNYIPNTKNPLMSVKESEDLFKKQQSHQ